MPEPCIIEASVVRQLDGWLFVFARCFLENIQHFLIQGPAMALGATLKAKLHGS